MYVQSVWEQANTSMTAWKRTKHKAKGRFIPPGYTFMWWKVKNLTSCRGRQIKQKELKNTK